jgi:anti-sigma factor RsiW
MNCQEFWNQVPESSRPPGAAFSAHLSECPACASAWARQGNVAAALRHVAVEWGHMEAPARVEARLVSAFRGQTGFARVRPSRPWIGALTWAAAAAAMLILAFSLVRVHGPQASTPKPIPANAALLAAVEDIPDGFETAGLEGGFLPLPNVEQLAPNEQGDLVTVEVPRSAMIALGFEVSPERASEPVQAEVMFGPDGVARAVRFLDETF